VHELQANVVVDQFLEGLEYPIGKAALLDRAREAKLPGDVLEALERLPDREYEQPAAVVSELNAE
jgi:hypothetical protein